ncbi:Galactoside O-acetyltransferase [Crocosphaera watsonii WH 0401]|uniref:Galactoside O-acetyltransferase n=1 Tax=Crocosphaera watsonii WH 0401 TaxID=555881 RepID=T2J9N8_CROWT|nr:Galactoside O-acetyltransferase [Crocosphaera watsonii WH 0401]
MGKDYFEGVLTGVKVSVLRGIIIAGQLKSCLAISLICLSVNKPNFT